MQVERKRLLEQDSLRLHGASSARRTAATVSLELLPGPRLPGWDAALRPGPRPPGAPRGPPGAWPRAPARGAPGPCGARRAGRRRAPRRGPRRQRGGRPAPAAGARPAPGARAGSRRRARAAARRPMPRRRPAQSCCGASLCGQDSLPRMSGQYRKGRQAEAQGPHGWHGGFARGSPTAEGCQTATGSWRPPLLGAPKGQRRAPGRGGSGAAPRPACGAAQAGVPAGNGGTAASPRQRVPLRPARGARTSGGTLRARRPKTGSATVWGVARCRPWRTGKA
mmetsp:Transcript_95846/g.270978  ORF Transcript_95846/g.270978 Transcript_95846/m.270978 type:complete len:280 (-) Transcript_95846:347-1186(-)